METCTLPAEVLQKLAEFQGARKTGKLVLDIKDGQVLGWRWLESGRGQEPKYALR